MKVKTHKATQKRIRIAKAGVILRVKSAKSHLLTHKANPTKTSLVVAQADQKKVKRMLPYG